MPSLDLFVEPVRTTGLTDDGDFAVHPPVAGLARVPLRQLSCTLRVPPVPGAKRAIIDTGAPLSLFPHQVWAHDFGWREGRDFDILPVAGKSPLYGQALTYRYAFRFARLRVPVELAGKDLAGPRLRVDSLVTQLAEPGGPPFIFFGLEGGAFDDKRLVFVRTPTGELSVTLEF